MARAMIKLGCEIVLAKNFFGKIENLRYLIFVEQPCNGNPVMATMAVAGGNACVCCSCLLFVALNTAALVHRGTAVINLIMSDILVITEVLLIMGLI